VAQQKDLGPALTCVSRPLLGPVCKLELAVLSQMLCEKLVERSDVLAARFLSEPRDGSSRHQG
jgi:hypothetical protein